MASELAVLQTGIADWVNMSISLGKVFKMDAFETILKRLKPQQVPLANALLEGVLEGFVDGILILTVAGKPIYGNRNALKIIESCLSNGVSAELIQHEIQLLCRAVIDSFDLYLNRSIVVESELIHDAMRLLRLRARWLNVEFEQQQLVLISLEDQHYSIRYRAIADAEKYGLTPREAQIWAMRRARHTYQEIATELYISVNTVKKHLKNIYAKLKYDGFNQHLRAANK